MHSLDTMSVVEYLNANDVNVVKDIIVPNLHLDKWVGVISLIILIKTFIKSNKIAALNFATQLVMSHRDIWARIAENKRLLKITDLSDNIKTLDQIGKDQRRYVIFIIINTNLSYKAFKLKIQDYPIEAKVDTGSFFCKPIPNIVWNANKDYYEKDFVAFVEDAIKIAKGEKTSNKKLWYKVIERFNEVLRQIIGTIKRRINLQDKSIIKINDEIMGLLLERNIDPQEYINEIVKREVQNDDSE